MTLCIAAACQERGKARIVMGTDWRAETYMAGADIQDKCYWIGTGEAEAAVLIAGTVQRAVELKDTYGQHLLNHALLGGAVTSLNVMDVYKAPLLDFKNKLANEYTAREFGLSYDRFLQAVAKQEIPERTAEAAFASIGKKRFDCALLIALFIEKQACILRTEDFTFDACEHFAAIGSGATIADGVLYQRAHDNDASVGKATYHVYEAMRLGSIAPGVSQRFSINVLYPPGERTAKEDGIYMEEVTDKGYGFLARQFKQRGPRQFARFPRLPEGSLCEE